MIIREYGGSLHDIKRYFEEIPMFYLYAIADKVISMNKPKE